MAEGDGLLRNRLIDESVDRMRCRIGFPNPTLRTDWINEALRPREDLRQKPARRKKRLAGAG